ncbi:tyrosine-type recombinase/integrase [Phyllobacterium bourgognense]|uniref:Site-specific recombinase XerD n=1 Tax=Phyllobacterium bourgognense TaxID=314236 RepID=A0A368Z749_9HYPH|nr:tyrosine-type recombinase/integrase [Phyllobacterium bourgognense]RCW87608.1 site-specific recombinase XerD [Phyllobacterium bourgognense]
MGDLVMAAKTRNWLERNGRYYARVVIPLPLRPFMGGKSQLTEPLGPDLRSARNLHSGAVARIRAQIDIAKQKANASGLHGQKRFTPEPISINEIAHRHYLRRLELDRKLRLSNNNWASISIDDLVVAQLRDGMAGKLGDNALLDAVGPATAHFQQLGNTTAKFGSHEWRELAMALCAAEFEVLSRIVERDEGVYSGAPSHPLFEPMDVEQLTSDPVSIRDLFQRYLKELKANGRGTEAEQRWTPIVEDFIAFAKTDDARRITRKHVIQWKDVKLNYLAPKTVKDVYLTALKATFNWAVANDILDTSPADKVKIRVKEKVLNRPKGFTREEAAKVLRASLRYVPAPYGTKIREASQTTAAKRWAPILCALTGSRITEITQLRKSDIQTAGEVTYIRISPDAGAVKNNKFRDVPLHQQLLDLGFLGFVSGSAEGPLFYPSGARKPGSNPAAIVSSRLAQWLQRNQLIPAGVSPNHGWRHSFKTFCREANIDSATIDAICGHAPRSVGEKYGDVTLKTMKNAIDSLPAYSFDKV